MIVFSQGSCRIGFPLTYLHCRKKIELIDPHWDSVENDIGKVPPMALGHFHNIYDHLRVFQLLQDDSDNKELMQVLNQINRLPVRKSNRNRLDWKETWEHCKNKFVGCDIAVIEMSSFNSVSSLNGPNVSDLEEIVKYMQEIESLIPHCKKLWVCHYRPGVIWNKNHKSSRETLYRAVAHMEHYFDPSPFLAKDEKNLMRDTKHYSPYGIKFIAERMLEKMESMK